MLKATCEYSQLVRAEMQKQGANRISQTPDLHRFVKVCMRLKEHMYFMKICCHPPPQ